MRHRRKDPYAGAKFVSCARFVRNRRSAGARSPLATAIVAGGGRRSIKRGTPAEAHPLTSRRSQLHGTLYSASKSYRFALSKGFYFRGFGQSADSPCCRQYSAQSHEFIGRVSLVSFAGEKIDPHSNLFELAFWFWLIEWSLFIEQEFSRSYRTRICCPRLIKPGRHWNRREPSRGNRELIHHSPMRWCIFRTFRISFDEMGIFAPSRQRGGAGFERAGLRINSTSCSTGFGNSKAPGARLSRSYSAGGKDSTFAFKLRERWTDLSRGDDRQRILSDHLQNCRTVMEALGVDHIVQAGIRFHARHQRVSAVQVKAAIKRQARFKQLHTS